MLKKLKKFDPVEIEEKVLASWKERHITEDAVAPQRKSKRKTFNFFEGPPTANGRPGIHHVLARSFKDIILRYKTMQGYYVPRKAGWDTHGLPVEIQVEKELGLKNKKDIEEYGIEAFNKKCRESTWKYKKEWEELTERIGFWLDLKHPYITYEPSYMESLWWILAEVWKKKLLYKGHKVLPWCTRCETALSSHELAQGYKEVVDTSVYVKFKLEAGQKIGDWKTTDQTYILSWTTTPWTLPGNVALAVGNDIEYTRAEHNGETLIFAKEQSESLELGGGEAFSGKELVGLSYKPLFEVKPLQSEKSYKIYDADFVTTTEGTGVVHTAVMYGEDDYTLGKKLELPQHHTVDEQGRFTADVKELSGKGVRAQESEDTIVSHLEKNNLLFKKDRYTHDYPFCWRCGSALIYYARESWFIAMSTLRGKLLRSNANIDWTPEHIKEGRFGEWLREVKDWAISRDRYWGTPLPIWQCDSCDHTEAISGIDELSKKGIKQKNTYFVMRHGQADHNVEHVLDSGGQGSSLTEAGKKQVQKAASILKRKKIDRIISSDVLRSRQSVEIIQKELSLKEVTFDSRLTEIQFGILDGQPQKKYNKQFPTYQDRFKGAPTEGEALPDIRTRVWDAAQEYEEKYSGENILIVSHEYTIWMLTHAASGWDEAQSITEKEKRGEDFIDTGVIEELTIKALPRNDTGEVDLHRPYIDTVTFPCTKCKGMMARIIGVADVWFDSGAMPFAQAHYPFEKSKKVLFPAEYISEAVDQTRGWFYTLLAVATLLGKGAPYKHVISLGHILDKHGTKMSKSKGNIVDPWEMVNKYGADVIRWHFFTANDPGEPKKFDEGDLIKTSRRLHLLIYNSFVFLDTYGGGVQKAKRGKAHVLDRWILSRYQEASKNVTEKLETYDITDAARELEEFVLDISRWYIRRSRDRFSDLVGEETRAQASETLHAVLLGLSKLLAPFCPFFAEALYMSLDGEKASVHSETWPKSHKREVDTKLLEVMKEVRRIASDALALRSEAGIRVRQPLTSLTVKSVDVSIDGELQEVLKDEVNVKDIIFDSSIENPLEFDTKLTPELYKEGILREIVRSVQQLRQDAGYTVSDQIFLHISGDSEIVGALGSAEDILKTQVRAKQMNLQVTRDDKTVFGAELDTKISEKSVFLGVKKI